MNKGLLLKLIMLFTLTSSVTWAQERTVAGQVTALEDGSTLPGVNVTIKGTSMGAVTDSDGRFALSVPGDDATLVFTFIGLKNVEVQVGARNVVNIQMENDITQLSEVVVVAYGTADKKSFTGSLGEVSSDQITKRPLTNVANALTGTLSGVQTNVSSGQPGSAPDIRVRGIGSVNASNSPLYVVDGVPYDQNINNISPDDIESISVLKDAASAALYGARAANGVVMITTKRGKEGKSHLSVKVLQGVTERAIPEYKRVSAEQYYPLMWESYRNSLSISGTTPVATANQMASNNISTLLGYNPFNVPGNQVVQTDGTLNPNAKLLYHDLDWYKPITRTGKRQDYNINYSGGNANSDYLVSVGYLNEQGYIINSDFERWTTRLNINTKLLPWLKTGANVSATYTKSKNARTDGSASYANPFNFSRNMGPIYPVYMHDATTGAYILDADGNAIYDLGNGIPARPSGASPGRHIVQETLLNRDAYKRTVISGRGYTEATFLKDFTFRANFGVDLANEYQSTYDNKIVGDGAPAGRASRTSITDATVTLNQLLTYRKTLMEKHNIEAMIGHESYSFVRSQFTGSRQGQITDGNDEFANFAVTNSLNSSTDQYAVEGAFISRVNYDYNGKYFLSGSMRRDGSSRFAKESRWGNFYSVGASWRMENEDFISSITWIDALKLRTSYGQLGNDNIGGYYPSQGVYDLGFNNGSDPGYILARLSNKSLTWETSTSFDVGTDFVLFNNRISGSLEFFNRKSTNLLFDVPLPLSSGIPNATISRNIGAMYNRGVEINLSGGVIKLDDFSWNVNVNASTITNKLTKLPQKEIISGTKKLQEGKGIYDFWLREYYGVNPANGAALFRANTYDETKDVIIGNDTLTADQSRARFHYNKSALPDVYGGITNTLKYKNFTLSVLLTYQIGGYVYDAGYQALLGSTEYGESLHADALKRWQKPGDITDVPRLDIANNVNNGATSDRWLTSATHLNLRQITLNYDVPKSVLSKLGVHNASVYVSGENLKLFSKRQGLNVTQNFTGVTSNSFIPSRVLSVGLNVGL